MKRFKLQAVSLARFSLVGVHIKELKILWQQDCPSAARALPSLPLCNTPALCFQSLTTSLHLYRQCLYVHILIRIERTVNSKIKIKSDITTCTSK